MSSTRPRPPRQSLRYDNDISTSIFQGRKGLGLSDPELLGPRMRRRRALTLILMTLFIPGSAQVVAGNRRLGRFAMKVWLGAVLVMAALAALALLRRSMLLGLFSNSFVLLVVVGVLIVAALLWFILFIDTIRLARLGGTPRRTRSLLGGFTVFLILLTCGSMVFAASNVLAGRSALRSVFGSDVSKSPTDGRYNVLLMGGDSGTDRIGTRPDTMMLASIDAESGKTVMFGFARNTEDIRFRDGSVMKSLLPDGWTCGDRCLLNGLYTWAHEHRNQFPPDTKDPGAVATKEAIEALSGLDVHYYVLVDLKGFQRLIDALGGLEMNVKRRTPIGGGSTRVSEWIEPGVQHLDGYHALWYARSRHGSSDYERMARQKCVMNAISQQLSPQTVILKFKDIAGVSGSVLQTDLPESDLGAFADLALKARGQRMKSVNFVPPLIQPWKYDPEVIRDTVRSSIAASESDTTPARRSRPNSGSGKSTGPNSSGSGSSTRPNDPGGSNSPTGSGNSGGGDGSGADDLDEVCSPA